jgi:hypothetical protein
MKIPSYVKQLRLVTAAGAARIGIHAEGPVFLSAIADRGQPCPVCGVTYTGLAYQIGYTTAAHHLHEQAGGIYLYVVRGGQLPTPMRQQSMWLAHVEPIGRLIVDGTARVGLAAARAEAIRCLGLEAWCTANRPETYGVTRQQHPGHRLRAGVLVALTPYDVLLPVCDHQDLPPALAALRFTIRDGTVHFQQRS